LTEPEARKALTEALALLLQLRDVGAMGTIYLSAVTPAIAIAAAQVKSSVTKWIEAKGQQ
jgi:hypothetical protein